MSRRHTDFARRHDLIPDRVQTFDEDSFELAPGVRSVPLSASHDELGVSSFRIDIASPQFSASVAFATDLGRVPERLIDHFRGVDVLAIESNYCPRMQMASQRPEFLKRRIMGGSGHLSNQQAVEAIHAIGPRDHVVLLHLSRECNDPALVASLHEGADYALTITDQDVPSRWIEVRAVRPGPLAPMNSRPGEQLSMFPAGMTSQ
jgi:phosphoribosyl 1,2-cyclic phosphodiesterase